LVRDTAHASQPGLISTVARVPAILPAGLVVAVMSIAAMALPLAPGKISIAHRGASAYAPEHTKAAYELAIAQGADYVEQDLAVTRDGILICLHDDSLERTTDVVFPDRFTIDPVSGAKTWLAADFTLAEIAQLDAGRWFGSKFAGERVPTWREAVAIVKGRAGMYPELKSPSLYSARGVDMVALVTRELREAGFGGESPGRPPLVLQSFDPEALRALARTLPAIPRVLLLDARSASRWLRAEEMREIGTFANGIAPAKAILDARPDVVGQAHALGLTVTPYTFRSSQPGRHADVRAEMRYFLFELGVDALFTDNPDRFPR
jgi:glycerophosphoryl diester phosphodiesterase